MTLSETLVALIAMLFGGHRDGDLYLSIDGRTMGGCDRGRPLRLPATDVHPMFIPGPILEAIEERCWALFASLAVRRRAGNAQVSLLAVLPATWRVRKVFRNPTNHTRQAGKQWVFPAETLTTVRDMLARFALQPSAIVVGGSAVAGAGYTVTALFAIDAVDVSKPAAAARAMTVIRELAQVLGAEVPAPEVRLEDLTVPIPGTRNREDVNAIVACPVCEPGRRYTMPAVEAAIARGLASSGVSTASTTSPIATRETPANVPLPSPTSAPPTRRRSVSSPARA